MDKDNDLIKNLNNDKEDYLHVNSINRRIRERTKKSMHVYEDMLKRCFRRVKASVDIGEKSCFYTLPEFIIGKPSYDMNECLRYIYSNVQKYGYYVKFIPPNVFFISWIHAYNTNYTPITNEHIVKTSYQQYLENTKVTEEKEKYLPQPPPQPASQRPPTLSNQSHSALSAPGTYKPLPSVNLVNNKGAGQSTSVDPSVPDIFKIVPRTSAQNRSWDPSSQTKTYKPLKFNKDMKNIFN